MNVSTGALFAGRDLLLQTLVRIGAFISDVREACDDTLLRRGTHAHRILHCLSHSAHAVVLAVILSVMR